MILCVIIITHAAMANQAMFTVVWYMLSSTCMHVKSSSNSICLPDHQMSVHRAGLDLSNLQGSWVS